MAIPALSGADTFLRTIERTDPARASAASIAVGLPQSLVGDHPGLASASARIVSLRDGRDLVDKAVQAAEAVLAGLGDMREMARLASHESYLSGVPDVSRLTLSADIKILVAELDKAVGEAAVGGVNLVSGDGALRIATTGLGGTVATAVQGLDSRTLGIDRLDLTTDAGVAAAITRISTALADATVKNERLNQLARSFGSQDRFIDDLAFAISSRLVEAAPVGAAYGADGRSAQSTGQRGTYVDLRA